MDIDMNHQSERVVNKFTRHHEDNEDNQTALDNREKQRIQQFNKQRDLQRRQKFDEKTKTCESIPLDWSLKT